MSMDAKFEFSEKTLTSFAKALAPEIRAFYQSEEGQRYFEGVPEAEKGGFEHFMLKEIYEQPIAIKKCFRTRLSKDDVDFNIPNRVGN